MQNQNFRNFKPAEKVESVQEVKQKPKSQKKYDEANLEKQLMLIHQL